MFGEVNLVGNGQSFSRGEGKAFCEEPLKACRKHHVRKATFPAPIPDELAAPEFGLIQCLNPGGFVLPEVTGVRGARVLSAARCLILQNSFYWSFAWFFLWKAESTGGGGGRARQRCRGQGKGYSNTGVFPGVLQIHRYTDIKICAVSVFVHIVCANSFIHNIFILICDTAFSFNCKWTHLMIINS